MGKLAEIDSRLAQTFLNGTWDKGHGTETERVVGRGTRDEMKWEGEAPAEPKRQRFANSEWRMVKRQRMVSSEW